MEIKKILLLCSIAFLFQSFAYSQKFMSSLIFGGNTTQIEGDEFKGFHKFGFNAGASVSLAFGPKQNWFATVELLYTQKGSHRRSLVDKMYYSDTAYIDRSVPYNKWVKYHVRLDYVEVPVVFHYEDPNTCFAIGLGFSWGRLVRISELENGYTLKTSLNTNTYKRDDWSALVDIRFNLYKNLKFNIRYQNSIVPIRTRTFMYIQTDEPRVTRKQVNQVLTVRLIYTFNEKFVRNTRLGSDGKVKGSRWIRIGE